MLVVWDHQLLVQFLGVKHSRGSELHLKIIYAYNTVTGPFTDFIKYNKMFFLEYSWNHGLVFTAKCFLLPVTADNFLPDRKIGKLSQQHHIPK